MVGTRFGEISFYHCFQFKELEDTYTGHPPGPTKRPPISYEHNLPAGYPDTAPTENPHAIHGHNLFKGTNNIYHDLKAFNKLIEEAKKHQSVINRYLKGITRWEETNPTMKSFSYTDFRTSHPLPRSR